MRESRNSAGACGAREAFQQRGSEPRFADARLAREEHYVAFAVLRFRPPPLEQIEFFFAPDKLRQAARVQSLKAAFD